MDLSSNKFDNSIPKNIGNLLKLNYLNMSNKKFGNDNIPIKIHILAHFSQLDLSHNWLKEKILSQISNLQSIEMLNIFGNNLSGPSISS